MFPQEKLKTSFLENKSEIENYWVYIKTMYKVTLFGIRFGFKDMNIIQLNILNERVKNEWEICVLSRDK